MTKPIPLSQFLARPGSAEEGPSRISAARHASLPALGELAVDSVELSALRYRAPSGYVVRELRGRKMQTTGSVFDEFAAAFQFPYYFGENKDAFDECLRDLDDFVGEAAGYVAVVRDSADLLVEQPAERDWFVEAINDCADYWTRRDIVFRVVLQGDQVLPQAVTLTL
ncbi:barstar family protein [Nocardia sp. GCM10030253]|uniref:barstar family protein n=1 Tax=Nocardia sp. GCM10030253 TaxID=3273404 RepID=UPI003631F2AA